ncbi:hypothetical protein F4859DRAFT_519010 [Xylaria cf. heliscus]|nr:hypothetical protein F4859DRAFT_519010 [Xylaria cf. heliscus]
MNPSSYGMEGSLQTLANTSNKLDSGNENNRSDFPSLSTNDQLIQFKPHHSHQGPEPAPSYFSNADDVPKSGCRFNSDVIDDCAKARFYARMLEIYLLDDEGADLSCPFEACEARDFKNPKAMLRHLKACKHFKKGVFLCPLCGRNESIRLRSNRRCRWDKEHLVQKILRKYKDLFRGFGINRSEAQKPTSTELCRRCSEPLNETSMEEAYQDTQSIEAYPMPSNTPAINAPNQIELPIAVPDWPSELGPGWHYELEPSSGVSELSGTEYSESSSAGNLSSENSPIHPQPHPDHDNTQCSTSGVSSATDSLDESPTNTNVSPGLSTHEVIPVATRRPSSNSLFRRETCGLTGYYGEANSSKGIHNQHSDSFYENPPINHSLGLYNTSNAETFIRSVNPPLAVAPRPAHPNLRLETPPTITGFVAPTIDFRTPLHGNQNVIYPTPRILRAGHCTARRYLHISDFPEFHDQPLTARFAILSAKFGDIAQPAPIRKRA